MQTIAVNAVVFLLISTCWVLVSARNITRSKSPQQRQKRLFSLFNVVNFENGPCTSSATVGGAGRHGTCFTASECTSKGGEGSDTCAAGFGICCVFTISSASATVTQNCTYLQNPGFPAALTTPTAITYNVERVEPSVCSLRLDFELFNIRAGTGTTENGDQACQDTFTITSPGTSRNAYPVLCGINTGHHVYVDFGQDTSTNINLALQFAAGGTPPQSSNWDIKTTHVPCGGPTAPPTDCFQWHTGITGTLTTFNFASTGNTIHLQNQDYSICIRQEAGFCCIQYSVCDPTNEQDFSLSGGWKFQDVANIVVNFAVEDNCFLDYIRIAGGMSSCSETPGNEIHDKFCGHKLNVRSRVTDTTVAVPMLKYNMANIPICDCSPPFAVDIVTDAVQDELFSAASGNAMFPAVPALTQSFLTKKNNIPAVNNDMLSRGVCLNYLQIPCA